MISPQFRPVIGGYERAAERLSIELTRLGNKVTVITEQRDRSWPAREQQEGITIRRLWCLYYPHLHLITSLAAFFVFLIFHGRHFHVWHIHQYGVHAVLVAILGKLLRRPVVLKLTNSKDQGITQVTNGLCLAGAARAWLLEIDAVVATTGETRTEARAFGMRDDRVHVVGNGIDTRLFHPRCESDRRSLRERLGVNANGMVVFAGRLSKQKNPDGLLRAWKSAVPSLPTGWKLVLVGDGPMRGELEAFIDSEKLRNTVLLMGLQSNVESWLGAADVFVLPSHFEGLSNSLLEAMSCGLPVVSACVSGSEDIFAETDVGELVEIGDVQALAEALHRLLADPARRAACGLRARQYADTRYSLRRVAQETEALYIHLLSKKG